MASTEKDATVFKWVDGICISSVWDSDMIRSALQYEAQPNDIFIVSYPRSGTTRMQSIIYTLQTNGQPFNEDILDFIERSMYLEAYGAEGIKLIMRRPGVIKTHIPLNRISNNPSAKYICVVRDPKAVAQFIEIDNISDQLVDVTAYYSSFDYMKKNYNNTRREFSQKPNPWTKLSSSTSTSNDILSTISRSETEDKFNALIETIFRLTCYDGQLDFVHKGENNQWKAFMSKEQSQLINNRMRDLYKECEGLENYWENIHKH
ncbi:unnamed protein product [Adineta steineri]|uniref:Sulfotransferase domain-containing protein n=1 Tax=Adineta steineri TaxID=433720 RepID=A0A815M5V2_9BILA|nr:unnamed protein product [Adineta steineri]CAF1416041.1 unnamed protein product [Adineta steineri]CAF1437459.1 unnamed protein product [Adineta steineri]